MSEIDINMDTTLGVDLEMESTEFVALAEKLQECYGLPSTRDDPACG